MTSRASALSGSPPVSLNDGAITEFSGQLLVGEHQKARGIAAQDIRLQGIESVEDGLQRAVDLEDLGMVQELQQ